MIFENNVEYRVVLLESEDSKNFILGKMVHVYNASCSCPGNNIKINEIGTFTDCTVDANGEYFYTLTNEANPSGIKVTSRSNFINFKIIKEIDE